MTDQLAEAASNERWRAEADEPLSDRPGIVASLLRYWLLIAVVTLLGAVAGYGVAQQTPVRYESEASLILSDPGGPTFLGGDPLPSSDRAAYLAKQSSIMTASIVLSRVVDRLGGGQSVRELRSRLQVRPSADMAGISIVARGPDSPSAASLANDVGIAYQDVAAERASRAAAGGIRSIEKIRARRQAELDASPGSPRGQLTARQQLLSNQIVVLDQREQDIMERLAFYGSGVELFERAERPESPTQPRPKLGALLGALLGLLVAGIWAWWAAARNQRTEGRGDPARILGAPLLGEVPALRASWGLAGGSSAPPALAPGVADAYHVIVASLEHELAGVGGSSVAVTSVGLDDRRTVTTLSIATAASEEHRKVLLIDADERTRRLSELYSVHEVDAERDLQVMRLPPGKRRSAQEYVGRLVDTGSAFVLPITQNGTDPDHPASSHHVPDVGQALSSVGRLFDLVLIDTPAVLAASDALRVAGQADGIVLLIPHRVLLRDLRAVRDRLAFVKTPLIGYVYVQPSGGVLERWTLGRPSQDARRQTETRKQGANAPGDAGGAPAKGLPVSSAQRSGP